MKRFWSTITLLFLVGLIIGLAGWMILPQLNTTTATTPPPRTNNLELIVPTNPNEITVEAFVVPIQSAPLSFVTTGRIAEILVREGEPVQRGQVIARLEDEEARAALAQAEAALRVAQADYELLIAGPRQEQIDAAQAALDAAQARLDQVLERADPLQLAAARTSLEAAQAAFDELQAGPEEEALIQASAELANAEAELRLAQARYDEVAWDAAIGTRTESRDLELATNAYIAAKAQYDLLTKPPSESELAAAQAQILNAQVALQALQIDENSPDVREAAAQVREAEAQLKLIMAGPRAPELEAAQATVDSARAGVAKAAAGLSNLELRAPFDGVVAQVDAMPGQTVGTTQTVLWLADTSDWLIKTQDLSEYDVVHLREGMPVTIEVEALPGTSFQGTIEHIRLQGKDEQNVTMYTVLVRPTNIDERLRWNMSAFVTFRLDN
ncbi:MAG: HlyD family efflux transporter periplasmic adaptor subunit [Ardenticatenia bacterium]|nr:MAG: HlyD family efflux transporter periplasmic adaptor subunit [Ardenticatenia bacterium]